MGDKGGRRPPPGAGRGRGAPVPAGRGRGAPIFDDVDVGGPKVQKPNRDAYHTEMKALDDQIAALKEEVRSTQQALDGKNTRRKDLIDEQRRLLDHLKPTSATRNQLRTDRAKLVQEIKNLGDLRTRKLDELTKLREKLPQQKKPAGAPAAAGSATGEKEKEKGFNLRGMLENIDLDIIKLESKLRVTSMTLQEEKKLVQEIGTLKSAKQVAKDYDQQQHKLQADLDGQKAERASLSARIQAIDEQLEQIQASNGDQQKRLEEVRAEIKEINDSIPGILDKRDALRDDIDDLYAKKKDISKRKGEEEAQFTVYMDKVREAKAEQRSKLNEQRAVDKLEKQKERAVEKLQETPFEAELDDCDRLISYLEQFLPKADETSVREEAAPQVDVEAKLKAGERLLKRDDDEDEALGAFKGKQKPKGKKPPKAQTTSKPDTILKHQINVLVEFEKLSLSTPSTYGAVPQAIQDLKQKKEHFIKLGVEQKKQLEAQVAKQRAEDAAKGSSSGAGEDATTDDTTAGEGTLVEASA